MTTLREIKKLVAPVLARHEDLALVRQTVILKPVRHILLGVMIDRTREAIRCTPRWVATELFSGKADIPVGTGEMLRHPNGLWWLTDPTMPEVLAEVVERDALPKLKALDGIRAFADFVLPTDPSERKFYAAFEVLCLLALGDLDSAYRLIITEKQARDVWPPHLRRLGLDTRLTASSFRLDSEERRSLAALLHDWEAYTVEKLGISAIWERTPFPLELSGATP